MSSERVMIYVDGNNLYHSLKDNFGRANLDFEKFCDKLASERRLIRTYYYNAPKDQAKEPGKYVDQQRFFEYVKGLRYVELRLGRLVYHGWPNIPPYDKGIDVSLATNMLVHAFRDNYDTAVLVSGDTDFADAILAVKELGKHVEVVLFGSTRSSQHLRIVADKVIQADSTLLDSCWR
jgi:uncharacterized LabA/DUF88 family protein